MNRTRRPPAPASNALRALVRGLAAAPAPHPTPESPRALAEAVAAARQDMDRAFRMIEFEAENHALLAHAGGDVAMAGDHLL